MRDDTRWAWVSTAGPLRPRASRGSARRSDAEAPELAARAAGPQSTSMPSSGPAERVEAGRRRFERPQNGLGRESERGSGAARVARRR